MSRSILVPHDGSATAQQSFEYAIDPFASPSDDDEVTALFEEAREEVDEGTVTVETVTAVGSPPQTIVAATEEHDVDQIVMGSRGRTGAADVRLGSAAELVVRRADVPVTVVR